MEVRIRKGKKIISRSCYLGSDPVITEQKARKFARKIKKFDIDPDKLLQKMKEVIIGYIKDRNQELHLPIVRKWPDLQTLRECDVIWEVRELTFKPAIVYFSLAILLSQLSLLFNVQDRQRIINQMVQILNTGTIPDGLRAAFCNHGYSLSTEAAVEEVRAGEEWQITDQGRVFIIRLERTLNTYQYQFSCLKDVVESAGSAADLAFEKVRSEESTFKAGAAFLEALFIRALEACGELAVPQEGALSSRFDGFWETMRRLNCETRLLNIMGYGMERGEKYGFKITREQIDLACKVHARNQSMCPVCARGGDES